MRRPYFLRSGRPCHHIRAQASKDEAAIAAFEGLKTRRVYLGPVYVHWNNGFGYISLALSRKRYLIAGHFVVGGWRIGFSKNYDYRDPATTKPCHRCGVDMERRGWASFVREWFYCPCCRCRHHTIEQIKATHKARSA